MIPYLFMKGETDEEIIHEQLPPDADVDRRESGATGHAEKTKHYPLHLFLLLYKCSTFLQSSVWSVTYKPINEKVSFMPSHF